MDRMRSMNTQKVFSIWRVSAVLLCVTFMVVHVASEIPSYIHVCARRDPNLDECIVNNIRDLKDKVCQGIPELDVPPNEILKLGDIVISNTQHSKIVINDTVIRGLCDYDVTFFHMDLDKKHFDVDVKFKQLQITGMYNVDIRILVPVVSKGSVNIVTNDTLARVSMDMKMVTKGGKNYMYMATMKTKLDIKHYDAKYTLDNNQLSQLREAVQHFIGNNQKEILENVSPVIEGLVSKNILHLSNQIVKHFTYEELFPERT